LEGIRVIFFLIGLLAGIIGGMGIGGGAILIPSLIFFAGTEQHNAQGVNLIYFIPTAIIALIIHIKNKKIDFKRAVPIMTTGIFGAGLGSWIASITSGDLLRKLFAGFLLIMGIYEMLRKAQ
jgi:uncharacterized membrane protein YfcA